MKEYQELLKILKVANLSIQILHRHLVDAYAWFVNHEQLGSYYEHVQNDVDRLVELGLSIGVIEPSINDALESYKELSIIDRDAKTSYEEVAKVFTEIIAQINRIKEVPADVINKLQEVQSYYRVEVDYKIIKIIK